MCRVEATGRPCALGHSRAPQRLHRRRAVEQLRASRQTRWRSSRHPSWPLLRMGAPRGLPNRGALDVHGAPARQCAGGPAPTKRQSGATSRTPGRGSRSRAGLAVPGPHAQARASCRHRRKGVRQNSRCRRPRGRGRVAPHCRARTRCRPSGRRADNQLERVALPDAHPARRFSLLAPCASRRDHVVPATGPLKARRIGAHTPGCVENKIGCIRRAVRHALLSTQGHPILPPRLGPARPLPRGRPMPKAITTRRGRRGS